MHSGEAETTRGSEWIFLKSARLIQLIILSLPKKEENARVYNSTIFHSPNPPPPDYLQNNTKHHISTFVAEIIGNEERACSLLSYSPRVASLELYMYFELYCMFRMLTTVFEPYCIFRMITTDVELILYISYANNGLISW